MEPKKIISLYASILVLTIIALFSIKIFDISYPLSVSTTSKSSELAVVGEGKIEVISDSASIQAGISIINASSVSDAQKTINETNNRIIDAVEKIGIKKSDIKTSNYSINPAYSLEGGKNNTSGYNGDATIAIKVKSIDLVPSVIDEVTKAGVNQVFVSGFNVENPQKYREEARNKAIENAKEQANKLASSLGIKLGKITNIVESSPSSPILYSTAPDMAGRGGVSTKIEPGTQTITSTVTLYFEKR